MEVLLAGQPNCGKSTILNRVVGYKSIASNFPGASVSYTRGDMMVGDETLTVVDLPGTYSLKPSDAAESAAWEYILNMEPDTVIVNVVDASVLSRSLELTLQLMELKRPMVLALNMMDEAERKHLAIDADKLSRILGIPVVCTNARNGTGLYSLFHRARDAARKAPAAVTMKGPHIFEKMIQILESQLSGLSFRLPFSLRFLAVKLLEKDTAVSDRLRKRVREHEWSGLKSTLKHFEVIYSNDTERMVSSFRHNLAFKIFEDTVRVGRPRRIDFRKKIDIVFLHPVLGYLSLVLILLSMFTAVYFFASVTDGFLSDLFASALGGLKDTLHLKGTWMEIFRGLWDGFGGGIIIAVSYLLPFFIILSILEDSGYLARISYLIDNIMHKIGLHGTSVIPMILGYGCTVPAVMGTRILKTGKDRFIAAVLTTLIPCSARMVVILGLVGGLFSIQAALILYLVNLVVVGVTGKIMSARLKVPPPGLVLEIPRYHLPQWKMVLSKTWFRMREFVVIAWPLLVAGSLVLRIIDMAGLDETVNAILKPFTSGLLGLPASLGVVLLFGIMRKELALVLFTSALQVESIGRVLEVVTPFQVLTFVVFVTFYMPCVATIAALIREFSLRKAMTAVGITFSIAVLLSVLIRLVSVIYGNL